MFGIVERLTLGVFKPVKLKWNLVTFFPLNTFSNHTFVPGHTFGFHNTVLSEPVYYMFTQKHNSLFGIQNIIS